MQLLHISIYAKSAGARELVLAVPTGKNADREHPRLPRGEQVPHRIRDHVALDRLGSERSCALDEEIGLELCSQDVTALHDSRIRTDSKRLERRVDLGPPAGGRDSVHDAAPAGLSTARSKKSPQAFAAARR
jgi:hypothetical protein